MLDMKRLVHNLERNGFRNRPISIATVASQFGLTTRPISVAQLWSRLVGPPEIPFIAVNATHVITPPIGFQADITITDPGHNTIKAGDVFELSVSRNDTGSAQQRNNLLASALSATGSMVVKSAFNFNVAFTVEVTAQNDAGSAVKRVPVRFEGPNQPVPQERPTPPAIQFESDTRRLKGTGFKANDTVFIRVQISGELGIRDSSALPTGLPRTPADAQGKIDTALDIKAAVPPVIIDPTTVPPTALFGCKQGETVRIQAHDSRSDPARTSNDFLWSNAVQFVC